MSNQSKANSETESVIKKYGPYNNNMTDFTKLPVDIIEYLESDPFETLVDLEEEPEIEIL